MKNNIIATLLFVYILFTFYITDIVYIHVILFHAILIFYLCIERKILFELYCKLKYKIIIQLYIFMFLFCSIWGLLSICINETLNFSFFFVFFKIPRVLISMLVLIIIVYKYYPKDNIYIRFMKILINACCIYVISTIIMIVFPEFKDIWYSFFQGGVSDVNVIAMQQTLEEGASVLTRSGLKGYSGLDCGFFCFISGIFIIYLLSISEKISNIYYIKFLLLILGCFFYSRTTLFLLIIGSIIFIPYLLFYKRKIIYKFLLLFIIIFSIIMFIWYTNYDNPAVQWSIGPIYNLIQYIISGGTNSLDLGTSGNMILTFKDSMIFDNDFKNLLIGHGIYSNISDSGFYSQYYFYGIIGLLVYYGTYFFTGIIICLSRKNNDIGLKIIILILLITVIPMEYKADMMMYYIPIIIVISLLNNKKNISK